MLNWSKGESVLMKKNGEFKKIIMLKKSNELNIKDYCSKNIKEIYKSDYFKGVAESLKQENKALKEIINCTLRADDKNCNGLNVSTLTEYKEVI